jgi:hypothetical protein
MSENGESRMKVFYSIITFCLWIFSALMALQWLELDALMIDV